MTLRNSRIFYIGMVCTDAYVRAIREDALVGAASGKMSSVVAALRLAGRRSVLISLPFLGKGSEWQPGRLCRGDGFPALFLPTWRSPAVRKGLGSFILAWFAMRRVRPHDTILFYNHAFEYLLALLVLRIRNVATFQDIEDLPISADRGLRGFLNRLGFSLMFKFASNRKVTASNQIGKALNLHDFLEVQGVAVKTISLDGSGKWAQLEAGRPLRVHYGGTLMASTGLDLFCSMVAHLDVTTKPIGRRVEFIITGVGDLNRIRDLALTLRSDFLRIETHQGMAKDAYFELLDSCHTSLSLRSPEAEISSTTFPSKVIEITSRGLALVSTRVSDVGSIFSDEAAWLLSEFNVLALTEILVEMAENPAEVRRRAAIGQALARERFAPLAIGRALADFLDEGPNSP